jgi:hypothetical protein
MRFPAIEENIWGHDSNLSDRFERVVRDLGNSSRIIGHERNGPIGRARVVITLQAPPSLVSHFHNSRFGYRAQYYVSPANGDSANLFAIRTLSPVMLSMLRNTHKRSCSLDFIEASLLGPKTKIWIYQGTWLHWARREDRVLFPARWQQEATLVHETRVQKLLRWGSLAPRSEGRLVLKGTVLDRTGNVVSGSFKEDRSQEIYRFGFT